MFGTAAASVVQKSPTAPRQRQNQHWRDRWSRVTSTGPARNVWAVGTEKLIYGTASQLARRQHVGRKTKCPQALRARRPAQKARPMERRRPRRRPAQDEA